mgnify:CR=1 FL=1
MVATDAIGMGLNLYVNFIEIWWIRNSDSLFCRSIKRVIFYSLVKPQLNEQGEKEKDTVTTSQALQIAGRAGRLAWFLEHTSINWLICRFASGFPDGEVTTFKRDDLPLLKEIVSRQVETIKVNQ